MPKIETFHEIKWLLKSIFLTSNDMLFAWPQRDASHSSLDRPLRAPFTASDSLFIRAREEREPS